MPNLHPFIVHFPLALYLTGLLFDLAGLGRRDERLVRTGWHLLLGALLGSLLAVGSGLYAEQTVAIPQTAREGFNYHEQFALLASTAIAAVSYWRLRAKGAIPVRLRALYLVAAVATAALLVVTGLAGGELVFLHGVGTGGR